MGSLPIQQWGGGSSVWSCWGWLWEYCDQNTLMGTVWSEYFDENWCGDFYVIYLKEIDEERRVSILHRERAEEEQRPNLAGGHIVDQVWDWKKMSPTRFNKNTSSRVSERARWWWAARRSRRRGSDRSEDSLARPPPRPWPSACSSASSSACSSSSSSLDFGASRAATPCF